MALCLGSTPMKANYGSDIYKINHYVRPNPCLTFRSLSTFSMSVSSPGWDGTIEYSTDEKTWSEWGGSEITAALTGAGYVLYFRGVGNTKITGSDSNSNAWTLNGSDIYCDGRIDVLLDYITVKNGEMPKMASQCYRSMFYGCTSLTQAPELPATTLSDYCYQTMFYGCTSLTQAPELPATTLSNYCYDNMFKNCTSLTQAPALPATTSKKYCYRSMFANCTSLTQAPALPITTSSTYCCAYMFQNCTSLTTLPVIHITYFQYTYTCYSMFYGCTSLKLSATQNDEYTQEYRINSSISNTNVRGTRSTYYMFTDTGGTFTGTPTVNTTYYVHSSNTIV